MIKKSISSMQLLLDDLLDISAMEKGKLELKLFTLNLSELIKERLDFFKPKAKEKDIEVALTLPESIMIEIDPIRITQVIDNLLSNAIKYSPKGSKVTINGQKEKTFIRINVLDEGAGIKADDIPQLFKAFKRLGHKTTGGESSHGLGLSICLKIIKAHKGTIAYKDNSEKKGSHFYFELPR
jgi:signal transduction histidine kinase